MQRIEPCAVCGTELTAMQAAATDVGWGPACAEHAAEHAVTPRCGPSGLTVARCQVTDLCDCFAKPVPMTAEQFTDAYTDGDPELAAVLAARGRYAKPCTCGNPLCVGWQMAYPNEEGEG